MKKLFVASVFSLLPVICFAQEKSAYDRVIARNEIVCGVYPWAPYKEIDPNTHEWKGFVIDYYRKAFATLDLSVTFKEVVLGTQVQDLNTGRVDAICDDGPYTMSAGRFVEFAEPVYASYAYPYVRKGDTRFKSPVDFNSEHIIFTGIDGDVSIDLVKRLFPKAKLLSMPGTTDVSQLFLNVATKKADIAIVDPGAFQIFDQSNPGVIQVLFKEKPLGLYKNTVSVKKGDMKMLGLVNQAIDNALAFGITDEALDVFDPKREKLARVRSKYSIETNR